MPRSAVLIAVDSTSDATWRAMLAAIKTNIEAMGWVQTSDTGQLDVTTSLKPTTTNQSRGYLLWRANDALAGSYPMILRMEFGSSGSTTQYRCDITVGSVTDGAGTISPTSNFYNRGFKDFPASSTTAYECYFCGDVNRLAFVLFDNHPSGTSALLGVSVERTHDSSGADTNVGIFATTSRGLIDQWHRMIPYSGTMAPVETKFMGPVPVNNGTLIGTSVGLFPIFPLYVVSLNQSVCWATYVPADISGNTIITFTMYGVTMTFLTMRNFRGPQDQYRLAMRYET